MLEHLSGRGDVELLQEVVHDENGDDDGDEDGVGEADDEDGADDVVQLDQQQPEVHGHRDVDDVLWNNFGQFSALSNMDMKAYFAFRQHHKSLYCDVCLGTTLG